MSMIAVVTLFFVPLVCFVVGQVDQLENECNILQTLGAHQDRLTSAETLINQLTTEVATLDAHQDRLTSAETLIIQLTTDVATLRKALTDAETEIANLKTPPTPPTPQTTVPPSTPSETSTAQPTTTTTPESSGTDCLDGWIEFQGSCYLSVNGSYTFQEAQVKCQELGGWLTHVETAAENEFIEGYVDSLPLDTSLVASFHWIGLDDIETEGVWKWTGTDSNATFFDWGQDEPNGGTAENCVHIYFTENNWNDEDCTTRLRPLCER